jgi:hypothetical protein
MLVRLGADESYTTEAGAFGAFLDPILFHDGHVTDDRQVTAEMLGRLAATIVTDSRFYY